MSRIHQVRLTDFARSRIGSVLPDILEDLLPVKFSPGESPGTTADAEIRIEPSQSACNSATEVSSLAVPLPSSHQNHQGVEFDVKFSIDAEVPFPFRGRVVRSTLNTAFEPLCLQPQDRPLATTSRGTVWSVCTTGSVRRFRSALALPQLTADQGFNDAFQGQTFLHTLPLLHFLRQVIGGDAYECAPLRATFIVDDPNLHWPRYGFVDYREIARHADRENYHVSFAMIPMDTWFTHRATADLFRKSDHRLSLLIHGNNHAHTELAQPYTDSARITLLQQALSRIERFERRFALHVSRVMVPPHGACSSDMLKALPRFGFEAACISAGSLRSYNLNKSWTRTLGYAPSEFIEGGPVLPRCALGASAENNLLIAAYLGQPMIARGHHQDLKDGPEVLDEMARFINQLGAVRWSNLDDLCRLNYRWRMHGTTVHLQPFGRTTELTVPPEATLLVIDALSGTPAQVEWQVDSCGGSVPRLASGTHYDLTGLSWQPIRVRRMASAAPATRTPAGPQPTSARLVLRRLVTEARDRLFSH